jgi:hypothetical protein
VASILDLAVIALAMMVCGTLGLLAWTMGIALPKALHRARRDLLQARLAVVVTERRLRALAAADGRTDSEGDR